MYIKDDDRGAAPRSPVTRIELVSERFATVHPGCGNDGLVHDSDRLGKKHVLAGWEGSVAVGAITIVVRAM